MTRRIGKPVSRDRDIRRLHDVQAGIIFRTHVQTASLDVNSDQSYDVGEFDRGILNVTDTDTAGHTLTLTGLGDLPIGAWFIIDHSLADQPVTVALDTGFEYTDGTSSLTLGTGSSKEAGKFIKVSATRFMEVGM